MKVHPGPRRVWFWPAFLATLLLFGCESSEKAVYVQSDGEVYLRSDGELSAEPPYFYQLFADSAEFRKTADNQYLIQLTGVDELVLDFTDRPLQQAGSVPTEAFFSSWQKGSCAPLKMRTWPIRWVLSRTSTRPCTKNST